jgi:hypothetical protein
MSEFLVSISGLGLADAGMEIWSGMALLAVLAFVLGFALNHGSICTVIAMTELVSEKRPARFIALVECAVWAALVYAILETSPTMQQGWSPLGYLVPAAMFGIGTYVNGACVFGSVGHFGNGNIDFGFAFLGIFAVFYIESLFDLLSDQPPISASLPLGPVLLAIALLAILALRLSVSLRSESNFRRLTLSMGAIGITFTILAVLAPRFSITTSVGSIVSIPVAGAVTSVCMFGGSLVSARFRKDRFMLEWPTIKSIVRRTLGGHPHGIGRAAHSRWERYAADDRSPHGGMAGCARLHAVRCVGCRTHRQIRFDGKILVMTVAHVPGLKRTLGCQVSEQRRLERSKLRGTLARQHDVLLRPQTVLQRILRRARLAFGRFAGLLRSCCFPARPYSYGRGHR